LTLAILAGAAAAYKYQMDTSPRAQRQKPPRQAKLVRVIPVERSNCATVVKAMGPVVPAQQVTLHPQVYGQITRISEALIPGGIVQAGENLVTIDPRDYQIQVQQRQGDVARALKDLKVEQGNQAIAKQEYELLGEIVAEEDQELVLREPQLASAQSALESAQAALEKAELDLARCDVTAPFNAIIQEKHVDLGATVSSNSQLVSLIATDEAWIDLKVPIGQLKWLTVPQKNGQTGSSVKIYNTLAWGPDRFRTGRVVRLYGEIETEGKMARLLVAVDDPFCLKPDNQDKPQLLMGSFVQAEIQGRTLDSVFSIKRPHIRDNSTVWIMDANDQLVATDIAAPVPGMPLRLAEPDEQEAGPQAEVAQEQGAPK
jgi:RND family efflux transporter MFP subunit